LKNVKLIHGDCLEKMKDIPDGSIDMVMADPPYGTTACEWDSIIPLEPMWEHLKRVSKPNAAIVLMSAQPFTTYLIASNQTMFKYCWLWVKSKFVNRLNAKIQPLKCTENVVVFYAKQPAYNPQGLTLYAKKIARTGSTSKNYGAVKCCEYIQKYTNYPSDLIVAQSFGDTLHPTQKPVALMEYLIKTYTNEGETVLDFCMGVGTTGEACQNLNRKFIGIEKEKKYFELAWQLLRLNEMEF